MNNSKLKTLTVTELKIRQQKVSQELSEARFDLRIGQEKDHSVIGKKRKELARINTLLHGYELGIYKPTEKSEKPGKSEKSEKVEKTEKSKKTDTVVKKLDSKAETKKTETKKK